MCMRVYIINMQQIKRKKYKVNCIFITKKTVKRYKCMSGDLISRNTALVQFDTTIYF